MKRAYGVAVELRHDSLHGLLIFLQELTELPVLLVECVVLNDDLSICPL